MLKSFIIIFLAANWFTLSHFSRLIASLNERQVHQNWKEMPSLGPIQMWEEEKKSRSFFSPAEKYKIKHEIIRRNVWVFCPIRASLHLNLVLATHRISSDCQCLCLHIAPVIWAWCLILCSYLLLSIRAFMGRCCQSYHGNQCLWQSIASPAVLWTGHLQVLLHSTF